MKRRWLMYVGMTSLIVSLSVWANPSSKLEQLQSQIQNLKSFLNQAQDKKSELNAQLQQSEISIGNLAQQLAKTQHDLQAQQQQLQMLSRQADILQKQIHTQEITLAKELRAIYVLGNQQYLKILLNQQDPNQLSRILTYYHYINHRRLQLIEQFNQSLAQRKEMKTQIETQSQQLTLLRNQQQQEQLSLENNQKSRQQLLQKINTDIQNKNQQLQQLVINKQRLENTVSRLEKVSLQTNLPPSTAPKGHLAWPTQGKIIEHFGTQIEQSQLKWNGVLIKAGEGQNVYAIMPGQVVFANWMSGYGLLMIVSHGDGYMTIYGRNHSLYKKVGDAVKTGELIATVGDSGGFTDPALYFAIRKNGKPLNPERLCS